jgi:phage N-6-adenine-methyltransferase
MTESFALASDVVPLQSCNGGLIRYEAACRAIAEAKAVDEAKDFRDRAEAMRAYAKQAKNKQLEIDAAEIRIRAERRIGELMAAQREAGLMDVGRPKNGSQEDPFSKHPTLAEAGIDKHLADRARKLAAIPETEFEGIIADWRDRIEQANERVTVNLLEAGGKHVRGTFGTGENEWYTPDEYLDIARQVLGAIDLDPATSELANERVKASAIFTADDNGLERPWFGRVWLNPPYAQPLISQFADKTVAEWRSGNFEAAIVLTHNYTDTAWFQKLAHAATAICFTRGRIRFVSPDGNQAAPTQGQAFFYFGPKIDVFIAAFMGIGFVVEVQG